MLFAFAGCAQKKGDTGAAGTSGTSTGTVSGTVTNASNASAAVSGVTVTTNPSTTTTITTDSSGNYTVSLPVGSYTFTYTKTFYTTGTQTVSVTAGQTTTANVSLTPTASIGVSAGSDQTAAAGASVSLTGTVTSLDGTSTSGMTYKWVQTAGTPVVDASNAAIALGTTLGTSLTQAIKLAPLATYKSNFFTGALFNPTTTWASSGAAPDRLHVQAIFPTAVSDVAMATFKLTATSTTGTAYTSTVNVDASDSFPYQASTGLQNQPLNQPVVIHSKTNASGYNWSLNSFTPVTSGETSSPTINDATTQFPYFTPDKQGTYVLKDSVSGDTISIYAADYSNGLIGSISSTDGYPVMGANCSSCHKSNATGNALDVYNMYNNEWRSSGHANILAMQLNAGMSRTSCFECHTTGYNTSASNNGFDDTAAYSSWIGSSMFSGGRAVASAANWSNMVANYPTVAAKANVQCEACHGPNGLNNDDPLHNNGTLGDAGRVSWSSGVCGSCHGDATRHDRYQQWLESPHNNTIGVDHASADTSAPSTTSYGAGDCGRCHTAQGFAAWVDDAANNSNVLGDYVPTTTYSRSGTNPESSASAATGYQTELEALGLDTSTVEPQTCQACHDPHDQGRTSFLPNDATVRGVVNSNDTNQLPAGFTAYGVGRGAVCMTCHNSRNGLHNDSYAPDYSTYATAGNEYQPPHHGPQADVLMGQNAYFVTTGDRSPHSYLPDTCANCHMELSPPPSEYSYASEPGTNHLFTASTTICSNCHGSAFTPDSNGELPIQKATASELSTLGTKIGAQVASDITNVSVTGAKYLTSTGTGTSIVTTGTSANAWLFSGLNTSKFTVANYYKTSLQITDASSNTHNIGVDSIYVWDDANSNGSYDSGESIKQLYPNSSGTFADSTALNASSVTVSTAAQTRELMEAFWNWYLINNDTSGGIHNPGFVNDVLTTTIGKFPIH